MQIPVWAFSAQFYSLVTTSHTLSASMSSYPSTISATTLASPIAQTTYNYCNVNNNDFFKAGYFYYPGHSQGWQNVLLDQQATKWNHFNMYAWYIAGMLFICEVAATHLRFCKRQHLFLTWNSEHIPLCLHLTAIQFLLVMIFLTQGNLSELGDDSIRSGDSLGIHGEQITITIIITTITIGKWWANHHFHQG